MNPLISVIINTYNYGTLLAEAVDSVLAQDMDPARYEIVVVDDGSTDDTPAVVARYDGKVRSIRQQNGGQASAINRGVAESRGAILCFLDADDYWAPNRLTQVAGAFAADPALTLVYHRLQPVQKDRVPVSRPIPRALCSGDISGRMARSAGWWPFPMTSAVSVRRSAWDRAGDIPAAFRISADAWLVGIYPLLGPVLALPDSLGYYRLHNNNWYRASDDAAMLRRRMGHWQMTVAETNAFLARTGRPVRLSLADHLPYHIAGARLNGSSPLRRVVLAARNAVFAGEPNLLRRLRDGARLLRDLRAEAAR